MTRLAQSNFIQGGFYHIYNRSIHKQDLFSDISDYKRYLYRIKTYKDQHDISILAYCLMPNHIHMLIRQNGPEPVSTFIQKLHTAYSMYFNKKYNNVGHVFENRFKTKIVGDGDILAHLSRYIHLIPAKLVNKLPSYKWSSYSIYLSNSNDNLLDTNYVLNMFKTRKESSDETALKYKDFVKSYNGNFEEIHKVIFDYPDL